MIFRPMLASRESLSTFPNMFEIIKYPLLCSPKLDGLRGIIKNNRAKSRTFKDLPSIQVQNDFCGIEHLDGEFIEGDECDGDVYNRSQSHVMSVDKPGDITYHIFDYCHPDWLDKPFMLRWEKASDLIRDNEIYKIVPHEWVETPEELIIFEEKCLSAGYEGVIARNPYAPYKLGRSTFNQGWMYKIKREDDVEGVVVGFVEQMTNNNTQTLDELQYATRSDHKDNKEPAGTLGKFKVLFDGEIISVAPGKFSHDDRKFIWENQELFIDALLKFRHFPHGRKDKPRHPRALGFRDRMDV